MFGSQSPSEDLGILGSHLIVIVVVEAIAGRGIDAAGVAEQKARIADTARLAKEPTVRRGALAGCWAGAVLIVGVRRAAH